tara:strand:- start:6019 stop:6384 length:366 start_codon:yes stop_codon:yes gene_type:complete
MAKENFLYFCENALGATATAYVAKASNFLGADSSAANKIKFSFKAAAGTAADDLIELTFTPAGAHKQVMEAVAGAMVNGANVRTNFNTVYDGVNSAGVGMACPSTALGAAVNITVCDITLG